MHRTGVLDLEVLPGLQQTSRREDDERHDGIRELIPELRSGERRRVISNQHEHGGAGRWPEREVADGLMDREDEAEPGAKRV